MLSLWIAGRIILVQTEHGGYWKKLGEDLTLFQVKIEAERGNIYTHDGRILATTIPTFELRMDTRAQGLTDTIWNKHSDSLYMLLSQYLPERTYDEWKEYLTSARESNARHLLLGKKIEFQDYKKIREIPLFKLSKNKSGFIVVSSNSRRLPFDDLAKRTIGYFRTKGVGIEGMQNEYLAGENRELLMQKVAGGVYMPVNESSELGSKPGLDIYTTIDVNLQDITEASLMKSVTTYQANHGSAILMNVQTGEIKAIANIGRTKDGEYKEIYNYAINELNEPGSVMKLASVMALIDEGYADAETQIDLENGKKKYYDLTLTDDHPVSGSVSLKKAFALSSNVGISKQVVKHFGDKQKDYYNYLEKIHMTKSYGLGLAGESDPILTSPNKWTGVTLPWLSIGYEIRVTPLQILGLYSAVANNGRMMKPYIVKEIRDNDQVVKAFKPEVLDKQICKPETIRMLRDMLEGVVDSGTADNIRNNNYKIAGKTGTNLLSNGKYGFKSGLYQASFVGYFPANNPVYACIVVINKPNSTIGYHGRECAAPVFKDIADRLYTTDINIHPALSQIAQPKLRLPSFQTTTKDVDHIADFFGWKTLTSHVASDWTTVTTDREKLVMRPSYVSTPRRMPNVSNMCLKDAVYILETLGLQVYIEGRGRVRRQSIPAGQAIQRGHQVKISLG